MTAQKTKVSFLVTVKRPSHSKITVGYGPLLTCYSLQTFITIYDANRVSLLSEQLMEYERLKRRKGTEQKKVLCAIQLWFWKKQTRFEISTQFLTL